MVIAEQLKKGNQQLLQELKIALVEEQKMFTGFEQALEKDQKGTFAFGFCLQLIA